MPRLAVTLLPILVLLWAAACSKPPEPAPSQKACAMPADCAPGQACVKGRCMTDLTRRQMAVPEARRAREQVEEAQQQIEDRRDQAIEAASQGR